MSDPETLFELRLGLALGKTISEIRGMSYPEFKKWQLFYLLEPFGFHDREYRTAVLLAQMNNVEATKKSQLKKPIQFIRDMPSLILQHLKREYMAPEKEVDLTTEEGRSQATQDIVSHFTTLFGGRIQKR